MKKVDARVRYTRKVLKEALLELLKEKPVNKITVKSVCELAGLNRATFYAHYNDCFHLLENIERELLDEFQKSLKMMDNFDVPGLIDAIYRTVREHEEACRVLIFQGVSTSILQKIYDMAKEKSVSYWKEHLNNASDAEIEMLYIHLSNGLMNVFIGCYDRYSKEQMSKFINRMVSCSMRAFM
ncbi:MAG: TetR/AcrR family transcriptional regulator [Erysipelotrichaceae bacterium]|jgi:AcrR family transcriptional regulator